MALSSRRKLFITLAAPLLALGGFELGLGLIGFSYNPVVNKGIVFSPRRDREMAAGEGIFVADDEQLWALKPNAELDWSPGERIDALGFRGPEPVRAPGALRVALLGESSVFGVHLRDEETLAAHLARALAGRDLTASVLNAGVVGHTVAQGLPRYETMVRPLGPDVVVIVYGTVNEHWPATNDRPDALRIAEGDPPPPLPALWSLRSVQALARLRDAMGDTQAARIERTRELQVFNEDDHEGAGAIDWPGTRRVPPADFGPLLRQAVEAVRADGALPLLVSMPRRRGPERQRPVLRLYTDTLHAVAEEQGVPLLDAPALASVQDIDPQHLFHEDSNWHLGDTGNAWLAQALADLVVEHGRPRSRR